MIEKTAVLFTNSVESTEYHLMFDNGQVVQKVLQYDRRASGEVYQYIYNIMHHYDLSVLWVHPDTGLSVWVTSADFKLIPPSLEHFSPGTKDQATLDKPYCLQLARHYLVMFPAYAQLKHSNREDQQLWEVPTAETLMHSVQYTQRALDTTFKFTPGYTAINLLRETNQKPNSNRRGRILPMNYDRWGMVRSHVVSRPVWVQRDAATGQQGLTRDQSERLYVIGGDKNAQFLGACKGLVLPSGEPSEISSAQVIHEVYNNPAIPSLWEYEIKDVSHSAFNSYDLYCPLSRRDRWASAELLRYCEEKGIQFVLKKGLAWQNVAGGVLDQWADKIWFALSGLKHHESRFPDALARANALGTCKKSYVEVIGRFCEAYSKEYYQRAWNAMIIHRAIRNQMASFSSRAEKFGIVPVLVVNDAFYILSDTPVPEEAYPTMFDHPTELHGSKCTGVCPLTDEIILAFKTSKPHGIETLIKKEMEAFRA